MSSMTPPIRMVSVPVDGEGRSPIYTAAYDCIRKGAPGLSDATCQVIARSINMKITAAPVREEGGAVDDWPTIDSAPQDGTKIDLWGHWPEHDRWARTPDAVWDEERCDWKVNGFYAGQYAHPPRFTHWRAVTGPAAIATREEAPADHISDARQMVEAPAEAGEDDLASRLRRAETWDLDADQVARDRCGVLMLEAAERLEALRARPQAREEAQPVDYAALAKIGYEASCNKKWEWASRGCQIGWTNAVKSIVAALQQEGR